MPQNMSGREHNELRRLRARAFRAQGGLCHWCKQPMVLGAPDAEPRQCSGDHLIPLHNGGKTVPGNIVAACRQCNSERHPELAAMGGGLVATAGDDTPSSPFAVLSGLFPRN